MSIILLINTYICTADFLYNIHGQEKELEPM